MGLRSTIKRLVRLVHDPVTYPEPAQPDAALRRENARAQSEAARQRGDVQSG